MRKGTLLLLAILAVIVLAVIYGALDNPDRQAVIYVSHIRNEFLDQLFLFLTFLGSFQFLLPLCAGVSVFLIVKKRYAGFFLLFFVFWSARAVNFALKLVFKRTRPDFDPLFIEGGYSFPSGHAMNSAAVYACILYLLLFCGKKMAAHRALMISTACGLIFLIAISRVYAGVHYPSDVAAGICGGLLVFMGCLAITRMIVRESD